MAQPKTTMDATSVQEVSKSEGANLPKTDVRYWMTSIFKATYASGDGVKEVTEWRVKLQFAGKRKGIRLKTPDKRLAAAKARDIYMSLRAHGWEHTLAIYDTDSVTPPPASASASPTVEPEPQAAEAKPLTVGEFLIAAKAVSTVDTRTIEDYCRAFRTIIANAILRDYSAEKQKRKENRLAWHEKVKIRLRRPPLSQRCLSRRVTVIGVIERKSISKTVGTR